MNEFLLLFKDAPILLQLVTAYVIIRGGHFGIDKYRGRNGRPPSKSVGDEIEIKLAPLVKQVELYYRDATAAWEGGAERHDRMIQAQNDIGKALQEIKQFMVLINDRQVNPRG